MSSCLYTRLSLSMCLWLDGVPLVIPAGLSSKSRYLAFTGNWLPRRHSTTSLVQPSHVLRTWQCPGPPTKLSTRHCAYGRRLHAGDGDYLPHGLKPLGRHPCFRPLREIAINKHVPTENYRQDFFCKKSIAECTTTRMVPSWIYIEQEAR